MRCGRPLSLTALVATAAVSLLAAGCGGGGSPGVARLRSSTTGATTITRSGLLAYSHCMRSHGVANFPDPTASQGIPKDEVIPLVSDPRFGPASSACKNLMPAGGLGPQQSAQQTSARVVGLLAFARCLRSHGFPSFPDPTSGGELTPAMLARAGIDLHEPALLHAADACTSATHGVITKAVIANFVAGR
jgi:hypothetical protein